MTEIPEYVGYANDLVEKVGERLEKALKDAVAEMATKSDIKIVEERAQRDREDVAGLEQEITKLRGEIKTDKAEAIARGRRIWRTLWTALGGIIVALAPSVFAIITHQ